MDEGLNHYTELLEACCLMAPCENVFSVVPAQAGTHNTAPNGTLHECPASTSMARARFLNFKLVK